ncbi:hypothetical protein HYG81_00305 [Natrinema zhouii]|uniref:Uncharacterized protein n=1 Tax=Natrinema zhouii TaxID=1710539 RepID=A0A7D6CQD5_9EURY|nr:hypothetical protein [Natrinema zhouii]QLK26109.1 hypothetical protein HYG81_00305 [Natrinema zhouii]
MSDREDVQNSGHKSVVERGEAYDHAEHGRVKITGIWKGVQQVDAARNADETGVIVVRYSSEQTGGAGGVDALTDTLDEFLAAIE